MNFIEYFFGGGKTSQYSNDYFIDQIKNTNLLSESTKTIYLDRINTILTKIFDKTSLWQIINNPNDSSQIIIDWASKQKGRDKTNGLSINSIKQLFAIIVSLILHHQEIQEQNPDLLKQWKNIIANLTKDNDDVIDDNRPNNKQLKALLPFDEIVKIRDKLDDGSDEKLLISMYTMIEPLRSNFDRVKFINGLKKDKMDNDENYIDIDKKQLILNKYKTKKVYDQLKIDLPNDLIQQIKISLEHNPRDYLFTMKSGKPYDSSNTFNKWANRIVKKSIGNDKFNLTMFRHIYLSRKDIHLPEMTMKQRKVIAHNMGHSTLTQDKYRWTSDNPKDFKDD